MTPGIHRLRFAKLAGEAEAETAYRQALTIRPDDPGALNNLALALKDRGRFDEASAIVRQRELHYHLVPSNPQIAGGKNIDVLHGKTSGAEAFGRQP